jgi:hypothetical protein
MRTPRLLFGLLVAVSAAASPAAADWLQMRDGSRIQTKGAWQVRGAQIAFTLPNGTLAAVRAADVDLEASERLTAEARAPKPAPAATPTARREPVLVLTDEDLAPAPRAPAPTAPVAASPTPPDGAPAPAPAATPAPTGDAAAGLEVLTWSSEYNLDANASVLSGTVRNTGTTLAYDLGVVVSTFDADGELLTRSDAQVSPPGLAPGRTGTFRVSFPGSMRIERAEFALSAKRASINAPSADPTPTPPPLPQPVRPAGAVAGEGAQRVRVTSWSPDESAEELSLVGELSNQSTQSLYNLTLTVTLEDAAQKPLATARALLAASYLQPGASTTFRVTFPGVSEYHGVRFQARESQVP